VETAWASKLHKAAKPNKVAAGFQQLLRYQDDEAGLLADSPVGLALRHTL
jgi:hypothetical protein